MASSGQKFQVSSQPTRARNPARITGAIEIRTRMRCSGVAAMACRTTQSPKLWVITHRSRWPESQRIASPIRATLRGTFRKTTRSCQIRVAGTRRAKCRRNGQQADRGSTNRERSGFLSRSRRRGLGAGALASSGIAQAQISRFGANRGSPCKNRRWHPSGQSNENYRKTSRTRPQRSRCPDRLTSPRGEGRRIVAVMPLEPGLGCPNRVRDGSQLRCHQKLADIANQCQ